MSARAEIENTLYGYAFWHDEQNMDRVAACFTADAVMGEANGRDEIRQVMADRRQARLDAGEVPRHITTNVLIEDETPTSARVHSYFTLAVTKAGSPASIVVTGRYDDQFVLEDGKWLISRRDIHPDLI